MVRVLVRDALERGASPGRRPPGPRRRKGGVMAKEIATFLVNGQEREVIVEPHERIRSDWLYMLPGTVVLLIR